MSRLTGLVEEVRLFPMSLEPSVFTLFEIRLMSPLLEVSFCGTDRSLARLFVLVFLVMMGSMMGSGSGSRDGKREASESLPREGSGDGCMELLLVRAPDSGDMIGDICCGLEAMDEFVMAEGGAVATWMCRRLAVWTWTGRGRRSRAGEVSCGGGGGGGADGLVVDDMVVKVRFDSGR